jgi:hypothetical protein
MSCTLQNCLKIRIVGLFNRYSLVMSGEHKKPIFESSGTCQNRLFRVYKVA